MWHCFFEGWSLMDWLFTSLFLRFFGFFWWKARHSSEFLQILHLCKLCSIFPKRHFQIRWRRNVDLFLGNINDSSLQILTHISCINFKIAHTWIREKRTEALDIYFGMYLFFFFYFFLPTACFKQSLLSTCLANNRLEMGLLSSRQAVRSCVSKHFGPFISEAACNNQ